MQRLTLAKRASFLLSIAAFAAYFYGLGRAPLIGPDEPRYAQVAREMLMRGDFVTPTLAGHTWFEKPALLYWMMMASSSACGVSEWSARIPSAVAGLVIILLVGWMAGAVERASGRTYEWLGLCGGGAMASTAGLLVFARAASFDIIVTMTITSALACFFMSEIEPDARRRRWLLAGFYVGAGASLLAKGLIGVVIPAGVVALYFLLRRRWPGPLRLGLLWGPLLTIVVAATWYAPVIARHGWSFIDEFFIQHHFARYVSNKYHHPQPVYFYLPIMALLQLPWTAFLVAALAGIPRWDFRVEDAAGKLRVLALAWLLAPVAFFSLSGSKLPGYILPALPGAALLVSLELARFVRGEGGMKAMRATGALALTLAIAGIIFALRSDLVTTGCALAVALPVAATGLVALVWTRRRRLSAALVAGVTLMTVALLVGCAVDRATRRESVRDLMRQADARGYREAPVFQLHTIERTAEFYAAGRLAYDQYGEPVKFEGAFQVAEAARRHEDSVLVFVPLEYLSQLTEYASLETEVIGDNGAVALVAGRTH